MGEYIQQFPSLEGYRFRGKEGAFNPSSWALTLWGREDLILYDFFLPLFTSGFPTPLVFFVNIPLVSIGIELPFTLSLLPNRLAKW